MFNFLIQIIISVFIGWSFVFLAKRYRKSQAVYFCVGFFICLAVRFIYLIIYGLVSDFKINIAFSYHRNLSILLSLMISYIVFTIIRKNLQKVNSENPDIEKIGKE
jgi:hypothetical protein